MAGQATEFVVQLFDRHDDKLRASHRVPQESKEAAVALADRLSPTAPAVAAVAIHRHENGAVWMISYLARHGDVPEDFSRTLISK